LGALHKLLMGITQIANGTNIPILHTVELLDWYTGGPKPKILQEI